MKVDLLKSLRADSETARNCKRLLHEELTTEQLDLCLALEVYKIRHDYRYEVPRGYPDEYREYLEYRRSDKWGKLTQRQRETTEKNIANLSSVVEYKAEVYQLESKNYSNALWLEKCMKILKRSGKNTEALAIYEVYRGYPETINCYGIMWEKKK